MLFLAPRTINCRMHTLYQKGVDNFKIGHKNDNFEVGGAVPT